MLADRLEALVKIVPIAPLVDDSVRPVVLIADEPPAVMVPLPLAANVTEVAFVLPGPAIVPLTTMPTFTPLWPCKVTLVPANVWPAATVRELPLTVSVSWKVLPEELLILVLPLKASVMNTFPALELADRPGEFIAIGLPLVPMPPGAVRTMEAGEMLEVVIVLPELPFVIEPPPPAINVTVPATLLLPRRMAG